MHRIIMLTGMLLTLVAYSIEAQNAEGIIIYENKVNVHRRLTGERENMRAMVPEFRIQRHTLFFNTSSTLYKPIIEDEEEDMVVGGGGSGVRIRRQQPLHVMYVDKESKIRTLLMEFMGRKYLIEDTISSQGWKVDVDDIREILGYNCRMAYYTDTLRNMEITAWYTTELPPYMGPESYHTLPGTVLAVDINNGETVLLAKKVELRALKKNELKKPVKGEKITQAEYEKMVEKEMERVRQSGGVMIRP